MQCIEPLELEHEIKGTVTVRCGNCVPCQVTTSRKWAVRGTHEFWSQNEKAVSLTLTYNDQHLPPGRTLVHRDVQLFMKRVRKDWYKRDKRQLRILGCGEYGDDVGKRPHYHIIIYGITLTELDDCRFHAASKKDVPIYTSNDFAKHWTKDGESMGFSPVQTVTPGAIKYVAGYVTKKLRGRSRKHEYSLTNDDGSVPITHKWKRGFQRKDMTTLRGLQWDPAMRKLPYVFASQRLGYDYFEKHYLDHLSQGGCTIDGKTLPLPDSYLDTTRREAHKALSALSPLCGLLYRHVGIPWRARPLALEIEEAIREAEASQDAPRSDLYRGLSRGERELRIQNRRNYHDAVNRRNNRGPGGPDPDTGTHNRSFDRDSFMAYVRTIKSQKTGT